MKRRLFAAAVPAALALTLMGCGGRPGSDLIGYWIFEDGSIIPVRIMLNIQREGDILTMSIAVPDFLFSQRVQVRKVPLLHNTELNQFGVQGASGFSPVVRVGDNLISYGTTFNRATAEQYAAFLQAPAILR